MQKAEEAQRRKEMAKATKTGVTPDEETMDGVEDADNDGMDDDDYVPVAAVKQQQAAFQQQVLSTVQQQIFTFYGYDFRRVGPGPSSPKPR